MKTILSFLLSLIPFLALCQPTLYLVNFFGDTVEEFQPNSSPPFRVLIDSLESPRGIAFDPVRKSLYISDLEQNKIFKLSNNTATELVDSTSAIALDLSTDHNKLFWTTTDDLILQLDLVTNQLDTIYRDNFVTLKGLAVAPDNTVFFANILNGGYVFRLGPQRQQVDTILADIGRIWDLDLDTLTNQLYFTNHSKRMIQRSDLNGNNLDTLFFNIGSATGIKIEPSERKLYWATEKFGTKIYSNDLDGNALDTLAEISPFLDYTINSLALGNISFLTSQAPFLPATNLSAYPNPCTDFLTYELSRPAPATFVELYDLAGKQLQRFPLIQSSQTISMRPYPAGTYFANLTIDGIPIQTIKIIKVNR